MDTQLTETLIQKAVESGMADVIPLEKNTYKVSQTRALIERFLMNIS
ncbi:hypothetical protein LPY66_17760 [Dehalobacter sp. DCM]|nr:hypothetical protein LPY66_17760 [Dehalobacter sp. DCM]